MKSPKDPDGITLIKERLDQAKLNSDKKMVAIWTAVLNKLLARK